MKKGQCKDALEIYKRFLTRMTRVSEFLKVAEVSNIKLCWEGNCTILAHVSGVNNNIYNLSRHSATDNRVLGLKATLEVIYPPFHSDLHMHSCIPFR